jgi:hypothetical protein
MPIQAPGRSFREDVMRVLILAGVILLSSLPSHAQHMPPSGGAAPSTTSGGGGGGGGGFGSSSISASFSIPHSPTARFQILAAHGGTYVPSTFVSYEEAVRMGQAALTSKPKSVVEAATETQAERKQRQRAVSTRHEVASPE